VQLHRDRRRRRLTVYRKNPVTGNLEREMDSIGRYSEEFPGFYRFECGLLPDWGRHQFSSDGEGRIGDLRPGRQLELSKGNPDSS